MILFHPCCSQTKAAKRMCRYMWCDNTSIRKLSLPPLVLAAAVAITYKPSVVCVCVGHDREPCKTAEPIEMPFGL